MKNKNIYIITLLMSIGLFITSCDINEEDYKAVNPVDSFQSTSTSLVIDSDGITYDVVVAASEAYTATRSVDIVVASSSTANGIDYDFTRSIVIPAGQLTGSTTIRFNFNEIVQDVNRTIVLQLASNSSEEIIIDYTKVCQSNDVELSIVFDNFPTETSWTITDSSNVVVATSGGTYPGGTTDFNDSFTFPDGDYTFTIMDTFGDGICCAWGTGSYVLDMPACSVILAQGGSFTTSESVQFSLP